MTGQWFDFEKPIEEVANSLAEAQKRVDSGDEAAKGELAELEARFDSVSREVYSKLTPWQRVLFARHKDRPRAMDYITALTTEFMEIHGDRGFADDQAVICGMARFNGEPIVVVGQQKGRDTKENVARNFGMMHPEGYRKALRVMRLADKFRMPILIFIDTPGAFPGVGAEERGQAEAIARNIQEMFGLKVPIIAVILGEGASGGALGIGLADRVLMLENAWYCVISPEGCAAILYKDAAKAPQAADNLKLTAPDMLDLGVIDAIIPEPLGGAHRHPLDTFAAVKAAIEEHLPQLAAMDEDELLSVRFAKYRQMGVYDEV